MSTTALAPSLSTSLSSSLATSFAPVLPAVRPFGRRRPAPRRCAATPVPSVVTSPAARPVRAARAPRRPLRLTRRGRLLVTCTAATALTSAVVAVTGAFSGASAGADRAPAPVVLTVQPGQTLSTIAAQWAPQEDWREVALEIVDLNALPSMTLEAGQQLSMPDRH